MPPNRPRAPLVDPPPEVGVTITTTQAAAALDMPTRTLRRYIASGAIVGHRLLHSQPWNVPTSEVARVAAELGITPDWHRVADLADLADVRRARTTRETMNP